MAELWSGVARASYLGIVSFPMCKDFKSGKARECIRVHIVPQHILKYQVLDAAEMHVSMSP